MSLAEDIPDVQSLIEEAKKRFKEAYGNGDNLVCAIAPGRVNLIGEHTDYNMGFVLPMALPLVTVVVGAKRNPSNQTSRILTTLKGCDDPKDIEFDINNVKAGLPKWANYVKGVIANFHGDLNGNFDTVIVSSVPSGGGVSSSAALEVAFYTFLEALYQSPAPSLQAKALACQKAEHDFAGMPCGIMDQFISTMGKEGSAVMIDCQNQEVTQVPIATNDVTFFIANSNVKHELTGSEYPTRFKKLLLMKNLF